MQKTILLLVAFISFYFTNAQTNFEKSNLPIILINTNGQVINDITKVVADLSIIDGGNKNNSILDAPIYQGKIGIGVRGSTSKFLSERKPYSVETRQQDGLTDKNVALLGLPKENDWAFIAPYADKSLIRDAFIYTLAQKTMTWAPHFRFVDAVVNGKYEGIYMVTEKIKQGKNRVDIDKILKIDIQGDELTGGYIFALDKVKNGDYYFSSKYPFPNQKGFPQYLVVSPQSNQIATEQQKYLKNWMDNFEDVLKSKDYNNPQTGYEKYIDKKSFLDYVLLNELSKNVDGYRLSTYFYKDKDSKDSRLHAGPIWDYNIAFGNINYCAGDLTSGWAMDFNNICPDDTWTINFWWQKLFQEPKFRQELKKRWTELRSAQWSTSNFDKTIDSLVQEIGAAQEQHFIRYPILNKAVWPNPVVNKTYGGEIFYLKKWLKDRADWIDGAFSSFDSVKIVNEENIFASYPNPVKNIINFEFYSSSENFNYGLRIVNSLGEIVYNSTIPNVSRFEHHYQIEVGNLANGFYTYQFYQNKNIIATGKFLKI